MVSFKTLFFILTVLASVSFCSSPTQISKDFKPSKIEKTITFKYQTQAGEVFLAGNFNSWKIKDPSFRFQSKDNLNWELVLPASKFKKGKNEYKLIVDGDWKINPLEKTEDSPLSGKINLFDLQ